MLSNKGPTSKTPGIVQAQFSIESACMCLEIGSSEMINRWKKKRERFKMRSAYVRPDIGGSAMVDQSITKREWPDYFLPCIKY